MKIRHLAWALVVLAGFGYSLLAPVAARASGSVCYYANKAYSAGSCRDGNYCSCGGSGGCQWIGPGGC